MRKFLIMAPEYDSKVGGVICLYKLCDTLIKLGFESYITPFKNQVVFDSNNIVKSFLKVFWGEFSFFYRKFSFKECSRYIAPIFDEVDYKENKENYIVIYPEIVSGNPLGARNVVRWLLHNPGFHTGVVNYGVGEMYIKVNNAFNDFYISGSYSSKNILNVYDFPFDIYREIQGVKRKGVAYCVRKGKGKILNKHPDDGILIDGKSHEEIAEIFSSVEKFISYDEYTAYSLFAVLSGCDSIVIPTEGQSEEQWRPKIEDRYGIAYGFERLEWARKTAILCKENIFREVHEVDKRVKNFVKEANDFFDGKIKN